MKVTVLVITYNCQIEKTILTLKSVIRQNFDDYEIVIADDGSKNNHFPEIEEFLQYNKFKNYRLVGNEKNQGTVKNLLSGLACTQGKYVKFIGAGDALYDVDTLQKVYDFMENNRYDCCFGLIQGFQWDENGEPRQIGYYHPFDIQAYRDYNPKRIQKNLMLYSDNVCGASIFYRTDFAREYMQKIQANVVYEEDIFQVLASLEGRPLHLFDDYMIWYEIGEGMTTRKKSSYRDPIWEDVQRFYGWLGKKFNDNKYVKKRFRLLNLYNVRNLYLRTFLRFFVNPDSLRYFANAMWQRIQKAHEGKKVGKGFLEQEEFFS